MRVILAVAAVLGASGVGLGALGAHALAAVLVGPAGDTYRTAALYHLVHALALLGVAALAGRAEGRMAGPLGVAAALFAIGIVLFSGSLYALALGGPSWLGPVTPLGGVLLIAGWVALGVSALRR